MRKLLYLLPLLILNACNRDNSPDPQVLIAKHQAPFGSEKIDVKLIKVIQDNRVGAEYIYKDDFLSEHNRYDARSFKGLYQTGTFKRTNGLPESYDVFSAYYNEADDYIDSTFKPYFSLTFDTPKSDSMSYVTDKQFANGPATYYKAYAFDGSGYIKRQDFWSDVKSNQPDVTTYIRDASHNISKSWVKRVAESEKSDEAEYTYDNHPNPFFKLGMDWNGDITVQSLSPNNITSKKYLRPLATTNYAYEYLPNGYPSKVTVRVENPNLGVSYAYTLEFVYQ